MSTVKLATPAVTTAKRKKSNETILKQKIRKLTRDLDANKKKVAAFEALKAEMVTSEKDQEKIQIDLQASKNALIKELGLA